MANYDFGTDTTTFARDGTMFIDFNAPEISGPRVPLEGWARVIQTKLGTVPHALTLGVSRPMNEMLNSNLSDTDLRRTESEYAAARSQVAGVDRVSCRFSRGKGKSISLAAVLNLSDGSTQTLRVNAGDAIAVLFPATT
jgi:hypothetical protein